MSDSLRENRPPGDMAELEAVWRKTFEDRLGAALIRPGGFRYEQMKVAKQPEALCKKGGTAFVKTIRPLQ